MDSVHEGTVVEVFDKGAVIALPYGVEGFVTPKHLVKEDGMIAKVDEKLMFKVIEFNKSAKKIIVSHSRVFEDEKKAAEAPVAKAESASPKKTARKQKTSSEKTTLGDISQLAALKEEMEEKENKASKK
jgi:small subunit ribosomal protein S1